MGKPKLNFDMPDSEKMSKTNGKTAPSQTKKRVILKREKPPISSDEDSGSEEQSSEEEVASSKKSYRKTSSPSKRSNKTRSQQPLLEKTNPAPEAAQERPYKVPDKPRNIIWVVKTESLSQPFIDPHDPANQEERYLTAAEIAWIVDVIPMVPAAVAELGVLVQQQIKSVLTLQLMREKVIPLGINVLRAEIEFHFYKGLVEPGKTIGVTCAESVGQPLTQITLSSFHQTGSATAGVSGVDSISEMFNISPERKREFSVIHFRNKDLNYDEVFAMRRRITGVSLYDLVEATAFIPVDEEAPVTSRGWWYSLAEEINGVDMGEDSVVMTARIYLRLVLNKQQLYFYDLTAKEIARVIVGVDDISTCVCVYSPTATGVIDIYPSKEVGSILLSTFGKRHVKPQAYRDLTGETVEELFLQYCIVNKMPEIIIKGVPGIKDLIPVTVKIPSYFKHGERALHYDSKNKLKHGIYEMMTAKEKVYLTKQLKKAKLEGEEANIWVLWFDDIAVRMDGVPHTKIKTFLAACGMEVLYIPPDIEESLYQDENSFNPLYSQFKNNTIYVHLPSELTAQGAHKLNSSGQEVPIYSDDNKTRVLAFDPIVYIRLCVDRAARSVEQHTQDGAPDPALRAISINSVYVYAEAKGINMQSLLSSPYVDPSRCRCNNFGQMLESFDIEVVRNAYIYEFHEHIVNNGAFISPRYLILIAEFVTNQGFLIPITSRGVSRQNIGSFAKASFEHAMLTFVTAAGFHRGENTDDPSTCIFVGRRAPVGTGLCQPVPDEAMLLENQRFEAENLKIEVDKVVEDVTTTLDELDFAKTEEFFGITVDSEAGDDLGFTKIIVPEVEKGASADFPVWEKGVVPTVKVLALKLPEWASAVYEGKEIPTRSPATTPLKIKLRNSKPLSGALQANTLQRNKVKLAVKKESSSEEEEEN